MGWPAFDYAAQAGGKFAAAAGSPKTANSDQRKEPLQLGQIADEFLCTKQSLVQNDMTQMGQGGAHGEKIRLKRPAGENAK